MKLLEKKIPPHRLLLYILLGSFLPILLVFIWNTASMNSLRSSHQELLLLGQEIAQRETHQATNHVVQKTFQHKDPLYLHNYVEAYTPLAKELTSLQATTGRGFLPEDQALERRMKFLSSRENSFTFQESSVTLGPTYKETIESQAKPVELDNADLEAVLELLEGNAASCKVRPHFIISDTKLERRKSLEGEAWAASFIIIKREYFE